MCAATFRRTALRTTCRLERLRPCLSDSGGSSASGFSLNHTNLFNPGTNQFYIGWTADGEWCNYTVNVKAGTYRVVALYGNTTNTIQFSINNQPATECKLPLATGSMHKWNKAEIGTITFPENGLQLLTFHYNAGNNFAYFEFEPMARP